MTDAEKREKVIAGLEAHANMKTFCATAKKEECPYYGYPEKGKMCSEKLAEDALALLKEQEPRVMTREEVIDLLQGSVVWFEEHSESGDYLRAMISSGTGFLGDFYLGVNAREVDLKRQRFWTSRPTEKQMRDTPWEGEQQ